MLSMAIKIYWAILFVFDEEKKEESMVSFYAFGEHLMSIYFKLLCGLRAFGPWTSVYVCFGQFMGLVRLVILTRADVTARMNEYTTCWLYTHIFILSF